VRFTAVRVTAERYDGSVFTGELAAAEGQLIEVEVVPLGPRAAVADAVEPVDGDGEPVAHLPARERAHRFRFELDGIGQWSWGRSQ
jgi:hypothetical protein